MQILIIPLAVASTTTTSAASASAASAASASAAHYNMKPSAFNNHLSSVYMILF